MRQSKKNQVSSITNRDRLFHNLSTNLTSKKPFGKKLKYFSKESKKGLPMRFVQTITNMNVPITTT